MATAYTPKAALRPRAGGATLLAAGLAGAVGGVAAHVVARAIYLAFLVPVAWGVAVGTAVAFAVRLLRLSRPRFAAVAAAAGVAVAAAVQVGLDYRLDRHERAVAAAQIHDMSAMGAGTTETIDENYTRRLEELTFENYLARRYGLNADPDPASGLASSLGPRGTIAVGGLELLVGATLAALLARRQALEPACPTCGAWRVRSRLGVAAHGISAQLVRRLQAGDAAGAADLIAAPDTRELVALSRLSCPLGHDGDGGVLRIEDHELDRRRRARTHTFADLELRREELGAIAAALEERRS